MAFEIGYRRPPPKSRFTKGQSGNPKGRPKGSNNFLKVLEKELSQPIVVTENGKKKKVTRLQALVMRLVTGALWKRGGALTSSFTGRIDCSDEIIRPMLSGDYQVILPCYGDRVFAQTEDGEMAFSLPGSKTEELVEGLAGTHKGGIRYPIPTFLRYTPQYPDHYYELEKIWAAGEIGKA